jgi:uncharacterized Zn finger protein (UPF0148 family)
MKKYNIEGNIDFFSELYKSLDDETKLESDINLCLITNQPLIDKFVELTCGHKFNYIPLFNDIYNHKKKFNLMEGKSTSLKVNEIRCPYCRKRQIGVLPYYEELIKEKTNGVNFYDETEISCNNCSNQTFYNGKCEFIITPLTNISINIKPYKCSSSYVTKLEYDNKSYCYIHNRFMIKKIEKEKKENEKKLKEELKQKKKEELIQKKNSKEELKQKKKEELIQKKNTKKELKQIVINSKQKISDENENENNISNSFTQDENIVISSNTTINKGCSQIIKTGLNKGNHCGLKIINDCLCKRHYNLKNKI